MLPLEMLHVGEWAEIVDIDGQPSWVGRLAELGIYAGRRLKVLKAGSPCLLQLDGCRLSLRSDATMQIMVHPLAM